MNGYINGCPRTRKLINVVNESLSITPSNLLPRVLVQGSEIVAADLLCWLVPTCGSSCYLGVSDVTGSRPPIIEPVYLQRQIYPNLFVIKSDKSVCFRRTDVHGEISSTMLLGRCASSF